jgi:hypothetical protein
MTVWKIRYHVQQQGCCGNPPYWVERIETVTAGSESAAQEQLKKQYPVIKIIEIESAQ